LRSSRLAPEECLLKFIGRRIKASPNRFPDLFTKTQIRRTCNGNRHGRKNDKEAFHVDFGCFLNRTYTNDNSHQTMDWTQHQL
jgi:hypothetical protein